MTAKETDAQKVAGRKYCPDGRLRCLDCEKPADEYCPGRQFMCGQDDDHRIRIVELEIELEKLNRFYRDAQENVVALTKENRELRRQLERQKQQGD